MALSDEYLDFVVEQLSCLGDVTARKMFGGAGIYFEGLFFALVADDVLYFKVDEANQGDYEALGMKAFKPYGENSYAMQYYEVPTDIFENVDSLREWAMSSIAAARRKKK
ncbi:MAG: TfoX/Sxy family protein [Verrucomicrobia bacterium]|nr:TfoX/Sxy family protein [Verrucomicrobiota bacterium]